MNVHTTGNQPKAAAAAPFGYRFVLPLALGSTLNPINSSMIATALVPIGVSFHAGTADLSWLIAGLYLASSVAQPALGRLADLTGPRRIYLVSLALVALAGLLGPFAPALATLVFVRVLIGVGTSGAYPSAMRIFRSQAERFGYEETPRRALSWLAVAGMSSSVIGPTLGGVLTGAFGWHAIFTVNVPLAAGIAVLVVLWIPKDAAARFDLRQLLHDLDLPGIGLFCTFLLALMFFLMNVQRPEWLVLAVSIAAGIVFVRYSLRRDQPFIDVRMLARNVPLLFTYARVTSTLLVAYAFIYAFGQWLETGPHLSSTMAGIVMLPLCIGSVAAAFIGGRMKDIRLQFIISIGSALLGCICMTFTTSETPLWIVALAGAFFGPPQGMFATATQAAIYRQAPAAEMGTAAGLQRTAGYVGAILAMSVLGAIFGRTVTDGGYHTVGIALGALSALTLVLTIFDRTLARR